MRASWTSYANADLVSLSVSREAPCSLKTNILSVVGVTSHHAQLYCIMDYSVYEAFAGVVSGAPAEPITIW